MTRWERDRDGDEVVTSDPVDRWNEGDAAEITAWLDNQGGLDRLLDSIGKDD